LKILKSYSEFQRSGIYCLFNLHSEKFYIGSSVNMSKRVWEHLYALKNNKHYNQHLQRAYNKYSNYFIGFVLEEVNKESLIEREQYWIDRFEVYNPEIGYNILPKAYSFVGFSPSEDTRKKMSELKTGENHYNFGKSLPEITKQRIGEGNKGKVRSKETKEKLRQINLGKTLSDEHKNKISQSMKNHSFTEEQLEQVSKLNAKTVYQYDLQGVLINVWKSAAEASRQLNLNRHFITRVCRGERGKYKNFIWRY
jgi:group I intron endonuclease